MTNQKQPLSKRLLATLLAMVMVFSMMPNLGVFAQSDAAPSMGIIGTVTDGDTLDSWKLAFDPVNITTQHAGGIWTDKTVLNATDADNKLGVTVGEDNFLVALSALAANSIIVGQGTTPTDTVFVLDISGSLNGTELNAMVAAANDAIHALLSGNEKNRVGVVLYSTNSNILLPLDHYEPVTDNGNTEYIERSNSAIRTGRVQTGGGYRPTYDYILDSNGDEVDVSVTTGGGTYIQGGLWGALDLFENVTVNDTRSPVMVLMSDGAPTYTTNYYSDVPEDSNYGSGNSSTAGDGFVTGLTASYVKNQIAAKYGGDAYLYTLGLGVDNVTDSEIAKAVLDPKDSGHADIQDLWDDFAALATAQSKSMGVDLGDSGWWNPSVTYTEGLEELYVDKYFSAAQASDLSNEFQQIVNEISLQNGYYVTHLGGENANLGGYITFVDEIGTGMQIKDMKGILIGEQLFTGLRLVQALLNSEFGTETEPTILGDNMVWALKQRLGITETSVVHELIRNAYTTGQIGMTTDGAGNVTSFSNYIGWFSDANGDYLGFWDAENPDAQVPAGAAYANKCYGMLGATSDGQTNHASDMMYVAVQVSKAVTGGQILDKTPEQVTFRVPAALLPMVTYQIELDGETVDTSNNATVTYKGAEPIRLLYEVGVHEKLNAFNIHEFVREGYQAKDENGNYYLYTNAWHWDGADAPGNDWADPNNHPSKNNDVGKEVLPDTAKNKITYAYFEPGEDNEHYYFTHAEQIYEKVGNDYVAVTDVNDLDASKTYYYKHHTFTTTQNGVENAGVIDIHYDVLSQEALAIAIAANSTMVPKGTMHFYGHSHDRDKAPNATGSYFAIRHHLVDAKIDGTSADRAFELIYMGNNGRITYAPAQGLSIEKQMADGSTPDAAFTFDVELTGPAGVSVDGEYLTHYINKDGGEAGDSVEVSGGKATVTVKPGEKVYILGLPTGTTYKVTERRHDDYLFSDSTGEAGTVPANHIAQALFTNRVRGVGSLNVTKTVTYNNGAEKNTAAEGKKFPVTVTLTDGAVRFNGTVKLNGADYTVTDGVITFDIVDGQFVHITGLPEGYDYTVTEGTVPAGYAYEGGTGLTGTITTAASNAVLHNSYTPDSVTVNTTITVTASKTMVSAHNVNFTFQFQLLQFDGNDWVEATIGGQKVIANLQVTAAGTSTVDLDLSGLTFTKAGTYDFRVIEVIPENQEPGMTYDRTFHDFEVVVTDADLDGKLEISKVEAVGQHTQVDTAGGEYGVTAGFTNTYALNSTKLTIQAKKYLTDITAGGSKDMTLKDGQFKFTLADATTGQVFVEGNGTLGDVLFPTFTYTEPGVYSYTVQEVLETKAGYTYDDAVYTITVTVGKDGENLVITNIVVHKDGVDTGYVFNAATFNNILNGDTLAFNNTYEAEPTTLKLYGEKTLTNLTPGVQNPDMTASIKAGDFEFWLQKTDGTTIKIISEGVIGYRSGYRSTVQAGGAVDFTSQMTDDSPIYYTEAGTYEYDIIEVEKGVSYITTDTAKYHVTVVVTDNGAGKLEVTSVTYTRDGAPTDEIVFNNTYKAEAPDAVVLAGTKTLSGIRNIIDGEFAFLLKDSNGKEIELVRNTGNNFQFAPLSFDALGTYTYTVTEVDTGKGGVDYDETIYTVTIEVTDTNLDGKMETTVTYKAGSEDKTAIAFANTYTAQPVKVALTGRKLLAGRPTALKAGEFSFTLTGNKVAGGSETKSNDADGYFSFSEIVFTEKGTYTFTVKENIPADADKAPGMIYDETEIHVTVEITDNGEGQLEATITTNPSQDAENVNFRFFNRYHAADTDPVELGGTKELTGRPTQYPLKDNEFSFVLKDEDGNVVETVKNVGTSFKFTGLVFGDAGVYNYTIEEVNGGATIDGVTYSNSKYDVVITVTDAGDGKLTASVVYKLGGNNVAAADVKFVNTYAVSDTETVELGGKKDLQDRPAEYPLRDQEFSFTITGPNLPAEGETVANDVNGDFKFSKLQFTEAGVYVYTVTEVHKGETINGVKYDDTVYTITITVTDDGKGALDSTVTYQKDSTTVGADDVIFTNVYDAADTDEVILEAGKELTGRPEGLKDNEFSFTITGPNLPTEGKTVKNVGGKVTFPGLVFDTVGTYKYTIKEVKGDLDYIDYDDTVYEVIVEVKDPGDGKLTAKVTYTKGGTVVNAADVLFTNKYQPKATDEVELGGNKNLVDITGGGNKVMTPGNDYSFNLKGEDVDETVTNNGSSFTFSKLTFTKAGNHVFTITEIRGNKGGITYDDAVYTVTVKVVDDSTGKLKVESVTYQKDGENANAVVFDNTYEAKKVTDVVIEANKVLTDITSGGSVALTPKDGDFSFNLKGENVDETVKNVGGKVTFSGLEFSVPGTYKYKITEIKGNLTGIGYDENTVYDVTVTVTDPGDGQLVAAIAYSLESAAVTADKVVFNNTFKAADAKLELAGKKILSGGRDLKAGEFSFVLKKGDTEIETVKNAANGTFTFQTLKFDTVGTYSYTISEIKGSDSMVKYDETVYEITVTVTYENGVMKAVAKVGGQTVDSYGFTNIFTPNPVSVVITAEKKLTNHTKQTMGVDGFSFLLTDGTTPVTKISGTDGLAKFELTFNAAGTYTYKLSEVKGDVKDMVYDETVYDITVTVTQDATTGALSATVSKTDNAVFTNVYGKPEEPPKTADDFGLIRWTAMLTVSAFSMLAVLVIGKKKLQEQ